MGGGGRVRKGLLDPSMGQVAPWRSGYECQGVGGVEVVEVVWVVERGGEMVRPWRRWEEEVGDI